MPYLEFAHNNRAVFAYTVFFCTNRCVETSSIICFSQQGYCGNIPGPFLIELKENFGKFYQKVSAFFYHLRLFLKWSDCQGVSKLESTKLDSQLKCSDWKWCNNLRGCMSLSSLISAIAFKLHGYTSLVCWSLSNYRRHECIFARIWAI